jgi:hypothetical protein
MKMLIGVLGGALFLSVANGAWGNAACEKCTHEMQVQYRTCLRTKDQATCSKEEQAAAQACLVICNPKSADPGERTQPSSF